MEIRVDDKWKLVAGKTGWDVMHYRPAIKGPRAGQLDWFSEGHFDTLQWALVHCYRCMLHQGRGSATLEQLARRIIQAEKRIAAAAEPVIGEYPEPPQEVTTESPWD